MFQTVNNSKLIRDSTHKPKGILCAHLNIRSIQTKSDQVHHLLTDSNIDFLCLSETWLHESSPSAILSVPGSKMFRKERQGSKGGGVMIYAKDTFICNEIHVADENGLEFHGLTVSLSQQISFTLVVIYRPPSSNVDFYEKLETLLKQLNFAKEVIIMGDLNVNWEVNKVRKKLKKVMDDMDMTQVINGPTRITNSTSTQIDLAFTNRPERILKSYNMLTGLSDHSLIMVTRKLNKKRFKPLAATEFYRIPKQEQQHFQDSIQEVNWDELLAGKNLLLLFKICQQNTTNYCTINTDN